MKELERQHEALVVPRFDRSDAWRLGRRLADRALADGLRIVIGIRSGSGLLFHASMPGATADGDAWVERKCATTLRYECSTALLNLRNQALARDPLALGWLEAGKYTFEGGAVPVRVSGVGVVAAVAVSGLTSDEDHDLVVDALRAAFGLTG